MSDIQRMAYSKDGRIVSTYAGPVKVGQRYKDRDSRMNGRRVAIKEIYYNENKIGRFNPKTWYARCETEKGAKVTIACRNLDSYKWELVSETGSLAPRPTHVPVPGDGEPQTQNPSCLAEMAKAGPC
jgi:hypothetical protein